MSSTLLCASGWSCLYSLPLNVRRMCCNSIPTLPAKVSKIFKNSSVCVYKKHLSLWSIDKDLFKKNKNHWVFFVSYLFHQNGFRLVSGWHLYEYCHRHCFLLEGMFDLLLVLAISEWKTKIKYRLFYFKINFIRILIIYR